MLFWSKSVVAAGVLVVAVIMCASSRLAVGAEGDAPRLPGSDIIPDDRRVEWKPGIPGGIPSYPVFASVKDDPYNARGDGLADDTAAIQKALNACPPGKAVLLPQGTYRLTDQLDITKGIVIRGEGPDKTRLINEATTRNIIAICNWDQDPVIAKITQGCTQGSTTITVDDASRFSPGQLIMVDQLNDPSFVSINGCGGPCTWASIDNGKRAMGQLSLIAAREGNTITLTRPLSFTFKQELSPQIYRTLRSTISRAGVEDLYLEMAKKRTDEPSSIKIWNSTYCWVRNVESYKNWFGGHVTIKSSLGCEVRDSYFHHVNEFGAGRGYGVWVFYHSTDTLIENNVFYYLNSGMMIENGGPGNVIAYNFSSNMYGRDYPDTDWAGGEISLHGAHSYMNLFEGNIVHAIGGDFYWGSASHTTFFRNSVDMECKMVDGRPMMAVIGVRLDEKNRFMNVIGNVLGCEGTQGILETPNIQGFGTKLVYRLGYFAPSSAGATNDPLVAATIIRHGNYDYITKETHWDPNIASHQLPLSLYLDAKPRFFGDLPWPSIGPDLQPMVGTNPARERFLTMPAKDRAAQDLVFLGNFLLAARRPDQARARAAFQKVLSDYPDSPFAAQAQKRLEQIK